MTNRRFLVLGGFVPRLPEYDWIQVAHVYEGERASDTLLASIPWVGLMHPTEPGTSALVLKTLLAEVSPDEYRE